MITPVEDNDFVLRSAAEELLAGAFACSLDQYLEGLAHIAAVALGREFVLQGNHLVQTAELHLFGYVIGQVARGVRAGPLAVFEHEGRVVLTLAHERERELVVLFGFGVIAHEDVGGQAAVGQDAPDGSHAVEIPGPGVLAVHEFEDAVATTLYGQVDVAADVGMRGNDVERLVAHILGVRGGEADAHGRIGFGHAGQEGREGNGGVVALGIGRMARVGVDVLSQQGDFFESALAEVAHFGQDALNVAAAFAPARVRHDAVVAEVVATAHDADESAYVSRMQTLRNDVFVGLGGGQVDVDSLLAQFGRGKELGQGEVGIGTGHQVGMVVLDEVLAYALGHASHDTDDERTGAVAAAVVEYLQAIEYFLLGIVANGAGVEQHGIGLVETFARLITGHLHDGSNDFAVGHVHLAAVCFDIQSFHE